MIDIEPIAQRSRDAGATLVLDLFQSAGIVPLQLGAWDVPVAVGGVLKWLWGWVSVMVPHPREVAAELNAEDVCDYRPAVGVRFSPHFYTTDEELDHAFAAVDDILRTGRWQRQEARRTIVT